MWHDFALRVLLALVLGAVIGTERQLRQRMAGLRTNALVAAGAALFVAVSALSGDAQGEARIAAQVVSGIGFLGAGVIMREGLNVRGLNTAATLWCSAAVGVLSGLGYALEAAIGTFFVLGANFLLRNVAQRLNRQVPSAAVEVEQAYRITAVCAASEEIHVRSLLLHMLNGMPALILQSLHSEDVPTAAGKIEVRADLLAAPGNQSLLEQLVSRVSLEKSVSVVRWSVLSESLE
ncbi:MAG TPA: MgtC/SapB family protein [Methylibium sp.]